MVEFLITMPENSSPEEEDKMASGVGKMDYLFRDLPKSKDRN